MQGNYNVTSGKEKEIELFISNLSEYKNSNNTTNIYRGNSLESKIRKENLRQYLIKMAALNPEVLLLGEAPGYKGCRLTGIPFSSEQIIINNKFFINQGFKLINKNSKPENEISATIVWNELANYNDLPLLWNIFPFHPHKSGNTQSNRSPVAEELISGKEYLMKLLKIFDIKQVIALGRKAESQIYNLKINHCYLRHPANGGKKDFVKGLKREMPIVNK